MYIIFQSKIYRTLKYWKKGRLYNFKEGDTFYNTKEAYRVWNEALKEIKLCVQVLFAKQSGFITYEKIETLGKEFKITHKKGCDKPMECDVDALVIEKQRIDHGLVRFQVLRPNDEKKCS